ncbi:hypothetical protein [Sphingomonas sp. M1-B02]|uniref:hypothetical protein n=1 Tax=Sphingomonas sp. M1-B02 TaxID=3114300 RepID=UPI00223F67FD|nr:hypothetical protein [Sphingomonas sp. S6-11]UZK66964.1 hypothetical protein OKW87_03795 [Sphingomonas sp. S6-11]
MSPARTRVLPALAFAFACLAAAPATAQSAPREADCRDDSGQDRCLPEAQARQRAAYGVAPIDQVAAAKTVMMRAFFVDGYGRDAALVSFVRAPATEPRVDVRFPKADAGPAEPPSLTATVTAAVWDELVAEGRLFERKLAPAPASAMLSICLHSWVVTVEAVDANGSIRRKTEGACDAGLAVPFAFRLAKAAVAAMPACGLIDPETSRNDITRLGVCTMLGGDRQAAAQALNAYEATWFANPRGPDFARALQYQFHEQVDFAWPGLAPVKGSQAASEVWAREAATHRFRPRRIFGERADRVRIEGSIDLTERVDNAPRREVPATMTWTRENGFGFRMRRLESGPLPR